MELDPDRLREAAAQGSKKIAGFTIADTPKEITSVRLDPYIHHFLPYNSSKVRLDRSNYVPYPQGPQFPVPDSPLTTSTTPA